MSRLEISLLGGGDTDIAHTGNGKTLRSSKSPDYGGSGANFSSTDLLAAALGSCIATNIEPVALRHGVGLDRIRVEVEKMLSVVPKRIEALAVLVIVNGVTPADVLLRFERAAGYCLIHQSLASHVAVSVRVTQANNPSDQPGV